MRLSTELACVIGIGSVCLCIWVAALELGAWYRRTRCLLCRSRRALPDGYCTPCFRVRISDEYAQQWGVGK